MNLTPPTPPAGSYDDPDAGWAEYHLALEEHEAAVLRERLLATGVQMAVREDRIDLALALLDSEIVDLRPEKGNLHLVTVEIESSVEAFRVLRAENSPQGSLDERFPSRLYYFLEDLLPPSRSLYEVAVRPRLAEVEEGWRERVRSTLEGDASNQGSAFGTAPRIVHNGLFYRSKSEVKIAKALEQVEGVLFWPNSAAMSHGVQKEPDFLIFYRDKSGVLEVDGPTHAGRAADDSIRDSYFQRHGMFVKHYPAEHCWGQPETVVKDFLSLLVKS